MTSIWTRALRCTGRAGTGALVAVTVLGTLTATTALAPPASALGTALYVAQGGTDSGDCSAAASPCGTISYALTQAAPGARINVSGTIKDRFSVTAPVTISGADAPADAPAVLDGQSGGTVVTVVPFTKNAVTVTLDHLTIEHGANTDSLGGGGVQVGDNGIVDLSHVVITANTSDQGGGGIESIGSVAVSDSTISGNTTGGWGGGGIGAQQGSITVTNSVISGNSTSGEGNGGGIEMGTGSTGGSVTITGSTVSGNAADHGGGVWAGSSNIMIRTSTISGNQGSMGGGVGFSSSTAKLIATTIGNNSATFGGGIYATNTSLSIYGTVVAMNAKGRGECSNQGGTIVRSYSLIDDGSCGTPGVGDVSGDPEFAALADNGGPTKTMAVSNTGPAAAAIPEGTTADGLTLCPRTDQTGAAAPIDNLAGCSIGAVEATGGVLPLNTLYVAQGGNNQSNDCAGPATPCATVTYALGQLPSPPLPVTIKVSGTIVDNITVSTPRPITISGADASAASPAVLDGGSAGPVIVENADVDIDFDHLTIQHGVGTASGGGGGLLLFNATARLTHVTVTANQSPRGGGGILNAGPSLVIIDSTISGNTSGTCAGCTGIGGGGIASEPTTATTIIHSTISGNAALSDADGSGSAEGGGIFNLGSLTLTGSTVSGNNANGNGGGIGGLGSATIDTSTIADNSAGAWGGGLDGRGLVITHSTIAGNTATRGTQVAVEAGTITLAASIIGTGTGSDSCLTVGTPTVFASGGYNLDEDGSCQLAGPGDVSGVAPQLAGLADNGGPTATMLPAAGGPAAAAIPAGTTGNGQTLCAYTDQRGLRAPVSGQTKCSRGAIEATNLGAPGFTSAASHTVPFGTRFRFPVTTDGGALTTLDVAVGSSLPAALTFTDNGDGSGALAGYVAQPGTYSFTFSASNGAGRTTTQAFTVHATKHDQLPLSVTSLRGVYLIPLPLTTTGGSGTGALTYAVANGTATGCAISTSAPYTLSTSSAGTCLVTATKAGDENFNGVASDPTPVTIVGVVPSAPIGTANSFATFTSGFQAEGVAVDDSGDVFVSDATNGRIVEYAPDGSVLRTESVADPRGIAVDALGTLYVCIMNATNVLKIAPDGTRSTIGAGFADPLAVAVDRTGNVFVTDAHFHNLSKITPDGTQTGIYNSAGTMTGVTVDGQGNAYVADPQGAHRIVKIAPNGTTSLIPFDHPYSSVFGVAVDDTGLLYATDASTGLLYFQPQADVAGTAVGPQLAGDLSIAIDPTTGTIFEASSGSQQVATVSRAPTATTGLDGKVTVNWMASPLAGTYPVTNYTVTAADSTSAAGGGQTCGAAVARPEADFACALSGLTPGDSYTFTVTATSKAGTSLPSVATNSVTIPLGIAKKPSPPLGAALHQTSVGSDFNGLQNVAVDRDGNAYVADTYGNTVQEFSPSGTLVRSIPSDHPVALGVDAGGNIYVARSLASQIDVIAPDGTVRQIGHGFADPEGLAVDSSGNVWVTDDRYNNLSKIDPNGVQTGGPTFTGGPKGVATDDAGNVYVADPAGHRVVKVAPDFSTSDFAATPNPRGIAIDGNGVLYVGDVSDGGAVRAIAPDGTVTTLAQGYGGDLGVAVARDGTVWFSASGPNMLAEIIRGPEATATAAAGAAVVRWLPPAFPGAAPIESYTVTATDTSNAANGGQTCAVSTAPLATACTVDGLTPGDAYTFTVTATSTAGTSDPSAPSNSVTAGAGPVEQAPLTIISTKGTVGTDLVLTTSGGSGTGAVTYTTENGTASDCTVSGSSLSVTGAGTCLVTAAKAGDDDYLPISSDRTTVTFTAALIPQSITFTSSAPENAVVGGSPYSVVATGGASGNPVTFTLDDSSTGCALSGSTVSFPAAGTCAIDANQAGNDAYVAAPQVQQRFHIGAGAGCTSQPFPDVALSSPFCGDIAWLKGRDITGGFADGGFHPQAVVSRQSMAAFLYRLENPGRSDPACTSRPFPDVALSSPFCGDIAWLKGQDITGGFADGGFHPQAVVSRQSMAAFLHRLRL